MLRSKMGWASALLVVGLAACGSKEKGGGGGGGGGGSATGSGSAAPAPAPDAASKVEYGWYRGVLALNDAQHVAFLMNLPAPGSAEKPMLVNGTEEIEIAAQWGDGDVGIKIEPGQDPYKSEITASITTRTSLTGSWKRFNPMWGELDIPFTAEHIGERNAAARFPPSDTAPSGKPPQIAGAWKLSLEIRGTAIGEFEQTADGVVTGYIRPERFGDGQNLAGNVRGDRVLLSTFDGRSGATAIAVQMTEDGGIEGTINIANKFQETFTGVRDDKFVPNHTITLAKNAKKFPLAKLDEPTYKGKPTVVVLFATWCPICAEVNKAVSDLYGQYHAQGLEVLGVQIDLSEDQKENAARLALYQKKYPLPWETYSIPGTPEKFASIPPLNAIKGFEALPVTVFIKPDQQIHAMYAGFNGIATGKKHQAQLDEWKRATEAILPKKP